MHGLRIPASDDRPLCKKHCFYSCPYWPHPLQQYRAALTGIALAIAGAQILLPFAAYVFYSFTKNSTFPSHSPLDFCRPDWHRARTGWCPGLAHRPATHPAPHSRKRGHKLPPLCAQVKEIQKLKEDVATNLETGGEEKSCCPSVHRSAPLPLDITLGCGGSGYKGCKDLQLKPEEAEHCPLCPVC